MQLHARTLLFLPHRAPIEPATGAGGEEALSHGVVELGGGGQAGVERGTGPLGVSEAREARGVPQVQHEHSTWEDRGQGTSSEPSFYPR